MKTDQAPMHYYKFNEDGAPSRSDFLFSDKIASRSICFHSQGVELLRLDKDGMIFNGQRITDAGEAYAAWMKTMGLMQERPARKPLSEDEIDDGLNEFVKWMKAQNPDIIRDPFSAASAWVAAKNYERERIKQIVDEVGRQGNHDEWFNCCDMIRERIDSER